MNGTQKNVYVGKTVHWVCDQGEHMGRHVPAIIVNTNIVVAPEQDEEYAVLFIIPPSGKYQAGFLYGDVPSRRDERNHECGTWHTIEEEN